MLSIIEYHAHQHLLFFPTLTHLLAPYHHPFILLRIAAAAAAEEASSEERHEAKQHLRATCCQFTFVEQCHFAYDIIPFSFDMTHILLENVILLFCKLKE